MDNLRKIEEALRPYKAEPASERLSVVMKDANLAALALAWTRIPKTFKPVGKEQDLTSLWGLVQFSWEDLEEATGLPPLMVNQGITALRQYGLIYPDGTMAPAIKGIMKTEIINHLKKFKEEVPKKPQQEEPSK